MMPRPLMAACAVAAGGEALLATLAWRHSRRGAVAGVLARASGGVLAYRWLVADAT